MGYVDAGGKVRYWEANWTSSHAFEISGNREEYDRVANDV